MSEYSFPVIESREVHTALSRLGAAAGVSAGGIAGLNASLAKLADTYRHLMLAPNRPATDSGWVPQPLMVVMRDE